MDESQLDPEALDISNGEGDYLPPPMDIGTERILGIAEKDTNKAKAMEFFNTLAPQKQNVIAPDPQEPTMASIDQSSQEVKDFFNNLGSAKDAPAPQGDVKALFDSIAPKPPKEPKGEGFDKFDPSTYSVFNIDDIEGTHNTNDDGHGRTAFGGIDKGYSPELYRKVKNGDMSLREANAIAMKREASVTYKKLPWLNNARQITQEVASILAFNTGGTGATKFEATFKLIEDGDYGQAIEHIKDSNLTDNHKRHIIKALQQS